MSHDEARGLARVLSSREYDDYFRICNGNTQVGASEIRELPLPSLENIVRLGRDTMSAADVNGSVIELSNLQQGG
jgi:adenine-specific DNA-methyltransferase